MPTILTRLFATEAQASNVVERLKSAGYGSSEIVVAGGSEGADGSTGESPVDIAARLRSAGVYGTAARKYAHKMEPGNALVILQAGFGRSVDAATILHAEDSIDAGVKFEDNYSPSSPNSLSIIRTSGKRSIIPRRAKPRRTKPRGKVTPFMGIKSIIRPKKLKRRPSHTPITKGMFPTLSRRKRQTR